MAEVQQVPGGKGGAAAVVDADVPGSLGGRAVHHRQRQAALDHRLEPLVALDVVLADEPVDQRGADQVGAAPAAEEHQPHAGLPARVGHALQEQHVRRVAEGEPQRVVGVVEEQQPQGAHLAAAEGGGQRVRPRVAEPAGRLQDPGPQLGAELIGMVVGVGHGGP
ncbi:MAG TPA: hypothetical protein VF880_18815 [Actinomycetes bacterium]